jgi:hypothetical protein
MFDPWHDETLHDDWNFELLDKEKRARARARQAKSHAAELARSDLPRIREVGDKLRACAPNSRCGSGADIQCGTAVKRHFMANLKSQFDASHSFLMVSIVPSPDPARARTLGNFDIFEFKQTLAESLADAGLGTIPVTGALDISLNTYSGTFACQLWVPHWTLFMSDCDQKEVTARLSRVCPKSLFVEKPVYVQPVTKTPRTAFSYAYKMIFDELPYLTTENGARRIRGRNIHIIPGHPRFKHLALHLDRIGLMNRIFIQDAK